MIEVELILNKFIDRLQDTMQEKGWNIKQLADFLGVPRTTVNSWLLKKRIPKIDLLYKIADCLNVTINYSSLPTK